MDTVAQHVSDDLDLDALMLRVRDEAGASSSETVQPQAAGEAAARELDLIRVLEAQGDWNEHIRQSLAALVDCIRMLRDDWADGQAGLRQEIGRLSALVEELRSTTAAPAVRSSPPGDTLARTRRATASPRSASKPRTAGRRRPRS